MKTSAKDIVKDYIETTDKKYITESILGQDCQRLGHEKYGKWHSASNYERRFRELKSEGKLNIKELKQDTNGNPFKFTTWEICR